MLKQFLLASALISGSTPHPFNEQQIQEITFEANIQEKTTNTYELTTKYANVGGLTIYYYCNYKKAEGQPTYPNVEANEQVWDRYELYQIKINENQTVPNYDFTIRTNYRAIFDQLGYNLDYWCYTERGTTQVEEEEPWTINFPNWTYTEKANEIERIMEELHTGYLEDDKYWQGIANDEEVQQLDYDNERIEGNLQDTGNIWIGTYTRLGYSDDPYNNEINIYNDRYWGTNTIIKENPIKLTIYADIYQIANNTEVIDLPGLLFTILGMPFSFISQAFNLTLFPNTAYAINVANLLFAVITALLIIIILRKVLR